MSKKYTPLSAAQDVEAALRLLEGRWKLVILFHLFGGKVLRYSDLERAIPNITQKMLGQQLRQLESDGIVVRKAYPQVFRFSWKWRKRSPIKIMERTHEEATEALYAGRKSRFFEAAFVGAGSDLRIM